MTRRIVDISLTFVDGMRGMQMEQNTTIANKGFNTTMLHLYSHAGTHMDAPRHFLQAGDTIDNVQLEKCIGPALDYRPLTCRTKQPCYKWTTSKHTRTKLQKGRGCSCVQTRISRLFNQSIERICREFRPIWQHGWQNVASSSSAQKHPLSLPCGPKKAERTEVHQSLLHSEMVIVESLANLRQLKQETVKFIASPLKLQLNRCDGSPVCAVVIEDGS